MLVALPLWVMLRPQEKPELREKAQKDVCAKESARNENKASAKTNVFDERIKPTLQANQDSTLRTENRELRTHLHLVLAQIIIPKIIQPFPQFFAAGGQAQDWPPALNSSRPRHPQK